MIHESGNFDKAWFMSHTFMVFVTGWSYFYFYVISGLKDRSG